MAPLLAVALAPRPAGAQAPAPFRLEAGLGPAVLDGEFGLQGAVGLAAGGGRWSVGVRGPELAFLPGESEPGYRWQRLENGQRRCREEATGRFARDSRCIDLETALAASLEARWRAVGGAAPLLLGGGYRVGDASGPYGSLRWQMPGSGTDAVLWHLEAAAGPSLFRLSFGVAVVP